MSHLAGILFREEVRELNDTEKAAISNLADTKHRTRAWIYGASPSFNYSKSAYFEGCGTIKLCMAVEGDVIGDAVIMGDFIGARDIFELTAKLAGKQIDNLCSILAAEDL